MKHNLLSVIYHSANQSCALISSALQSSIPDLCISRVLRGEKELDFILPAKRRFAELFIVLFQ